MERNTDDDNSFSDQDTTPILITPAKVPASPRWPYSLEENRYYIGTDDIPKTRMAKSGKKDDDDDDENVDIDMTFLKVLDRLFDTINLKAKKHHEIIDGLIEKGVTTWDTFLIMGEDDIRTLSRKGRHSIIPLTSVSIRSLLYLKHLLLDNISKGVDGAMLPETYTKDMYMSFVLKFQTDARENIYQAVNTSNLPAITTATNTKSPGEKKYDAWNRGRRNKASFEVLHEDKKYPFWKIKFEAELHQQKLDHLVDPSFDPTSMTDSFDKELWKEQLTYFWTVLLEVFANPLGKTCINNHISDRNSRAAFLEHTILQDKSPAKIYNNSEYLGKLQKMTLATYNGSRASFIAEWFGWLTLLNDNSTRSGKMGFDFVCSQLLQAVQDDNDLPKAFTNLKVTDDDDVDLEYLKTHLLHEATLYDGKDDLLRKGPKRSLITKAHIRQLADIYGDDDPSVIQDIQEFASYRTMRGSDPKARLPDTLFSTLQPGYQSAWRNTPESFRKAIVGFLTSNGTTPPPSSNDRRSYNHSSDLSTITDNDFLHGFKRAAFSTDTLPSGGTVPTTGSSGTVPPVSGPPSNFGATPSRHVPKSKESKPLLSNLDPAHPASILSKNKQPLYDKLGTYQGYINGNFHQWLDSHDSIMEISTTNCDPTTYSVSQGKISHTNPISLVDRGANGFVGGADCVIIGYPSVQRTVNITGIDNHQMVNVPIATVGALVISNRGPVICVFHEVAYTGKHQTIMSAIQMEHHGIDVNDRSKAVGGKARLSTPDGFLFPLSIVNGLPYIHMRPYTDSEYVRVHCGG